MLIGVDRATRKIAGKGNDDRGPADTSGTPAATTEPKTRNSASAASGREISSASAQVRLGHRLDVAVERRARRTARTSIPGAGRSARAEPGSASGESSGGRSRRTMS